jgi:hypothetical protein
MLKLSGKYELYIVLNISIVPKGRQSCATVCRVHFFTDVVYTVGPTIPWSNSQRHHYVDQIRRLFSFFSNDIWCDVMD